MSAGATHLVALASAARGIGAMANRLPSASAPATKLEQISCRMRKFCHAGDDMRRLPTVRTYNGLRPSKVQQWTEGRQRRTTQVDTQVDPGGCHRANLYRNLIWQSCMAGTNARNPRDQSGVPSQIRFILFSFLRCPFPRGAAACGRNDHGLDRCHRLPTVPCRAPGAAAPRCHRLHHWHRHRVVRFLSL